jgi:hypothetical protein
MALYIFRVRKAWFYKPLISNADFFSMPRFQATFENSIGVRRL